MRERRSLSQLLPVVAVRGVVAVLIAVVTATAVAAKPGYADFFGDVNCEQHPGHPECRVAAGAPAEPAGIAATAGGAVVCRDADGGVVDCFVEGEGWIWSDGCRYLAVDATAPGGAQTPGAAYRPSCPGDPPGSQRALVWIPDSQAPGPAALGRIAVSRLVLPPPEIELSPPVSAPQLVMLPTWLWVDSEWWALRAASASVPGVVTVTAIAEPTQVVWDTGDGRRYVCGRGTRYEPVIDPAGASPDCGHVYRRSSAGEPAGSFRLTATVSWRVSWSGGGASGTAGPLFSTVSVPVRVVASRSVNIGALR
jgi:hypothetical protein